MLESLSVVQVGTARAAQVCTRLLADLGATVRVVDPPLSGTDAPDAGSPGALLDAWLALGRRCDAGQPAAGILDALRGADLVVVCGLPRRLAELGLMPEALDARGLRTALVYVTPYGLVGPRADEPATDLTLLCESGIARVLTGQVDDPQEAPVRAVGEQSAFIAGLAGACAGMHLVLHRQRLAGNPDRLLHADVSIQEALATLDIQALARAGLGHAQRPRRRHADGNGATVTILPCADGYVAVSPREDHQWEAWLEVMGSPGWGREPRFARKADRVANFDDLHALMSAWSRTRDKASVARAAQAAHVPSFPLGTPAAQLHSQQLAGRGFFRCAAIGGREVSVPGPPFGLTLLGGGTTGARRPTAARDTALPLAGIRVLDFSWVIAGPTTTRYLAAFGAEVIKVEAPGRGDPGRSSELHTVLGQGKRAITLDLKSDAGRELARALARASDVVIENFATGVMDRLGLGEDALRAINPGLIHLSASGLGRTGPESRAVAYGTLLQCYAGFAALNGHPGRPPRVGMAWLDPMCALMLAFIVAAGLWRRERDGSAARIDFSMAEAMLWTMAAPLLESQHGSEPAPRGNGSSRFVPHAVYQAAGDDAWVAIAVQTQQQWRDLCALVPRLATLADLGREDRLAQRAAIDAALGSWCASVTPAQLQERLNAAGVPCSAVPGADALRACPHLAARGFWEPAPGGHLPGLPWRVALHRAPAPAPALGADNARVCREVLGLDEDGYRALCARGAFGPVQ